MRRKSILWVLILSLVLISGMALADEKADSVKLGWENKLNVGLNFTQAEFSNWTKGGDDVVSWQLNILGSFDYIQDKYNFDTDLKFQYGRNTTGDLGERKTTDELRTDFVFNYKAWQGQIEPYASVRFLTQVDDGYKYTDSTAIRISGAFDPAYLTEAIGLSYIPGKVFKADLGLAMKQTMTQFFNSPSDDPDTPEIEKFKNEPGVELVLDLGWEFYEKMLLKSKMISFSNLKAADEIDVNWDNIVILEINSWLNVNFQFQIFYDKDVSDQRQLRQSLAIGLNYSVF